MLHIYKILNRLQIDNDMHAKDKNMTSRLQMDRVEIYRFSEYQ